MNLRGLLITGLLVTSFQVSAETSATTDFAGNWVMDDGSAVVSIEPHDDAWQIRILALRDPTYTSVDTGEQPGRPRMDQNNPDPALTDRPLLHLVIGDGFTLEDRVLTGGRIYDPGSGNRYRSTLTLMPDGLLKVRGFIGISLLGRTMYWYPLAAYKDRMSAMLAIPDC